MKKGTPKGPQAIRLVYLIHFRRAASPFKIRIKAAEQP